MQLKAIPRRFDASRLVGRRQLQICKFKAGLRKKSQALLFQVWAPIVDNRARTDRATSPRAES